MPQVFNHFIRFLIEHEPKFGQPKRFWFTIGLFLILVSFMLFLISPFVAIGLMAVGCLCTNKGAKASRDRPAIADRIPAELAEVWDLLRWMASRRELSARTHPELRDLLEDIALTRRTTLDSLSSGAWKDRASTQEGAKAIRDIELVLQDALYDAVFIGRHLFRGKGQRESTFNSRCADHRYGRDALIAVSEIRDEVRLLGESAREAGGQSDLRTNLVRQRLQSLVAAERELGAVSNFDASD